MLKPRWLKLWGPHRGARKMNLFYYRGCLNHNFKVPPRFIFRAPLLHFWPFILSNDFSRLLGLRYLRSLLNLNLNAFSRGRNLVVETIISFRVSTKASHTSIRISTSSNVGNASLFLSFLSALKPNYLPLECWKKDVTWGPFSIVDF